MDPSFARFHYEVFRVSDRISAQLNPDTKLVMATTPRPTPRFSTWRNRCAALLQKCAARIAVPAPQHT